MQFTQLMSLIQPSNAQYLWCSQWAICRLLKISLHKIPFFLLVKNADSTNNSSKNLEFCNTENEHFLQNFLQVSI